MPEKRPGRGPHPKDLRCFASEELPRLRSAVDDLCWLLSKGYSRSAAHTLVSDRYRLRDRQRKALQRCAASDGETSRRAKTCRPPSRMAGERLLVDGFNVLLTLETALCGGPLLLARDGVLRDLSSLQRHYRRTSATSPSLALLGGLLDTLGVSSVLFVLDRPISNSGRLRRLIEEMAREEGWPWGVELAMDADSLLSSSEHVVASADSQILDRCSRWLNLARIAVERSVPESWIVEL